MQQLDAWLDEAVIDPLSQAFEEYGSAMDAGVPQEEAAAKIDPVVDQVKKAIKEKILESYHNGQKGKGSRSNYARGEGRRYGSK